MARQTKATDEFSRQSSLRTRKKSWFWRLLVLSFLLLAVAIGLGPTLLSSPTLANKAIASLGGLHPLKLQIEGLNLGWFSAVGVNGIKLIDASGNTIAKVGSVTTEKSLLGWIVSRKNLGTIRIDGTEAQIVAGGGTTNIEEALAQLLNKSSNGSTGATSSNFAPSGSIEITNTRLLLQEQGRPEQWVVEIPTLQTQLPIQNQLLGPTTIQARLADVSNTVQGPPGEFRVEAQQSSDGSIQVQASFNQVPLEAFHLLRARVPDLPIQEAAGRISGALAGAAISAEAFAFDVKQLQVQNLGVQAPTLIGAAPATIKNVNLGGKVTLANNQLKIENTDLACDFGRIQANAALQWPIQIPSAANPFLTGAVYEATGHVDLPKLVIAAQSLIPMRPDTQLSAGALQFKLSQQTAPQTTTQATVVLSGLEARAAGQQIRWSEPVTVEVSATQQDNKPQFGFGAIAEFCNIRGGGTIENGKVDGTVDLDLLERRLSQFVQLPLSAMNGKAQVNLQWTMDAAELVTAKGSLETTPIVVATTTGAQMKEPAWQGTFQGLMQLRQGTPIALNQFQLQMLAADEQLNVSLQEPLRLNVATESTSQAAGFQLSLVSNLENCKHRAMVWMAQQPEMQLNGKLKMDVAGKLDTTHAELLQANLDVQSLQVRVSDFGFAEPQVIGKFTGRVDTNDLTKLQIDQLTVQSSSFSLLARDEAAEQNSRRGKANCFVDLGRLMNSMKTASPARQTVTIPGTNGPQSVASQYSATGQIQASLDWIVNALGAEFRSQAAGKDVAVLTVSADSPASQLWSESQLNVAAGGRWVAQSGAVALDNLQVQTPWLNYQGKVDYQTTPIGQDIAMAGQALYDAGQLSTKISPMTGNNLQLAGQYTMPIEVTWHRDATDTTSPVLAGLQAKSRVGWEQARVVGIELGKADVPVQIQSGKLTTAAEIPVSGGVLRWDLDSDLTQDQLVIHQKPMTVLENVAITREMCSGWLKYVAPLMAEATSIEGRLSLSLRRAELAPTNLTKQTVEGQLVMHNADVGPGALSNEIIGIVKQIEAIRKPESVAQSVSNPNKVWLHLPPQQIDFAMVDGKVHHKNVRVDIGDATITTAGSVDVGGQLELVASMPIPDKWTDKGPVLTALRGQTLQFPVRGAISRPQVDSTALRQIGRQTIENAAQNAIQQQLNKGLEKLFK